MSFNITEPSSATRYLSVEFHYGANFPGVPEPQFSGSQFKLDPVPREILHKFVRTYRCMSNKARRRPRRQRRERNGTIIEFRASYAFYNPDSTNRECNESDRVVMSNSCSLSGMNSITTFIQRGRI